jgi:hypothetical protein
MTHSEKVALAVNDLVSRGVRPLTAAPPIFRLLWRLRVPIRPPHFMRFRTLALFVGIGWGATFDLYIWAVIARSGRAATPSVHAVVAVGAALFGLLLALFYWWQARRLGLPPWEQYPDQAERGRDMPT